MKAFDVHAVDYLLKRSAGERFEAALELAKSRIGTKTRAAHELAIAALRPQQFLERLVVKGRHTGHVDRQWRNWTTSKRKMTMSRSRRTARNI